MSDEESFVILGTSPTSSLDTINSLPTEEPATTKTTGQPLSGILKVDGVTITDSQLTASTSSSNSSQFTAINASSIPLTTSGTVVKDESAVVTADNARLAAPPEHATSSSNSSNGESLATSFILGQVDSDVLKSNINLQFPSISAVGSTVPELDKDRLFPEFQEMKRSLMLTNWTMTKVIEQHSTWKDDFTEMEAQLKAEIAKLRNEKLELQRDLETRIEQIKSLEAVTSKENEERIRGLSEKTAQLENMKSQIQKLEQQQLASYVFIPKNSIEPAQQTQVLSEYVPMLEHQRIVKKFEQKLSELLAENLEIKDMQKQYIDEINCLRVNLESSNELLKKAQADINLLKACDVDKNGHLMKINKEYRALKVQSEVLKQQVDIYMRDFKMEQDARENLANEKEILLNDLRDLQRKNQELIQEAQRTYEEHTKQTMVAKGAFPKSRAQLNTRSSSPRSSNPIYTPANYNCPLCGAVYKTLSVLQNHLDQCLDKN